MFSAVCCGVWLELSNQKPIRGVVCILLNTNSMYTERYKEWEGFRRSRHCRKIQKFKFSHNAYFLVFGSALNMVFITARSVLRQISAFLRLLCWNRYKKAGTQVLEPYLSFTLFAPQEYLSRTYHDAVKYDAVIETTSL